MSHLKTFCIDFYQKRLVKHYRHQSNLQHFEQESIIFIDISLSRLDKTMSIAMPNMTESPKNYLTMSNHSKKFSFRLEKYNNTKTVYK